MSSAASSASPSIARSSSHTSRRHPTYAPPSADIPHRAQSTTTRPSSSTAGHRSTSSRSHSYDRHPPSNQAAANIARRDYEDPNVARPQSSRRSSSREGQYQEPSTQAYRSDPTRTTHRSGPRHGQSHSHSRHTTEMSGAATAVANGGSTPVQPSNATTAASERPAPTSGQPRRRTTITAQTGQWALGKTIGAGSMGKVKLAKNLETGEQVAVKIVPRQSTDEHHTTRESERADRSKEIRTAREAAMVTLLNHPYICAMRDVQRTNYHWYMLFEYVNGGQMLDYIISHGRLKEKQARKFGRQIASALDYCHRNSIVHRDLKIENILISKNGDIKIIDFGLSNLFSPKSHLKTFCGSLYFAAPELLQARQYTGPEVDVWSFGIVLYVLVCGKVPFDDQSMPQLHAKIKKGLVDYPQWLSTECRSIISRMLVTDPKQRASMSEIMNHPWMTKGFNTAPENFLPHREPLQLPLEPEIVEKMSGFDFGPADYIKSQLTKVLESEDYQNAVRLLVRDQAGQPQSNEKKRGVFDFYKRRNSTTSRDTLSNPSNDALQLGSDPLNAFSPLISIYYLAREKRDRERVEANPGAFVLPTSPAEKPLKILDLAPPEAAHTNEHAYEIPGEKTTGGRSRPRARTQGEDDVADGMKKIALGKESGPTSPALLSPSQDQPIKKESTAAGILRRLSTRRPKDRGGDRDRDVDSGRERTRDQPPPSLQVQPPEDLAAPPRKSFSVRRTRNGEPSPSTHHQGGSQPQHQDLLSPEPVTKAGKILGRSTSVNSGEYRRRQAGRRGVSEGITAFERTEPPQTSGSDRSSVGGPQKLTGGESTPTDTKAPTAPRSAATNSRTKSLGHARRESIQARRQRRVEEREANVPEETDAEMAATTDHNNAASPDMSKPVYLKGLFSVSTTSNKPLPVIRADIIRVLKQLGVEYTEIKGGFSCRHAPSIDLNTVVDNGPPSPDRQGPQGQHRRRISFGGFRGSTGNDRDEFRSSNRRPGGPDRSFTTNSEDSADDVNRDGRDRNSGDGVPAGETTTHVQSDLGGSLVVKFEIFIVKVPLFALHGIQFKKVAGGTWDYKNLASKILEALRL